MDMDFNKVFQSWEKSFYTEPLLLIIEITTIIVGLKLASNNLIGKLFIIYISIDLLVFISIFLLMASPIYNTPQFKSFVNITNVLIALIELLVYSYYFTLILSSKKIKLYLLVSCIFYFALMLLFVLTEFTFISNRTVYFSFFVGGIEFILILPPCIIYFRELLSNVSNVSLSKRPSFWIVTGIFFYALISVPYFLLNQFFYKEAPQFGRIINAFLFYTTFAINFLFLIKAFLCKKLLTT